MSKVFFIRAEDLKTDTIINYNVEDKILENCIFDAQKIDLEPILSTNLYNTLIDKVSGSTLTGVYKTLMDEYIYYTLIKSSQIRAYMAIQFKIREKGIMTKDDEYATSATITNIQTLINSIRSDYNYYANRLISYLCKNSSLIPEYTTSTNNEEVGPDRKNKAWCGIYLQ